MDDSGPDATAPADVAAGATDALDPELAAVVTEIEAAGVPQWSSLSVASARALEDEVFASESGPPLRAVRDLRVDGPGGDLPIRVYRPEREAPPTLVFTHGGGFTLGTLDSADDICRELADRAGALVLSVDYRLAPEHPFPAATDDAYAALAWASEHASDLGGDPDRLGVAGTSAGANLAAASAIRARNARRAAESGRATGTDSMRDPPVSLDGQFLLYPMTDRRFDRPSYEAHGNGPLLTAADVRWFWDNYLRSPVDEHNPFATVGRATDLDGLAPATVVTAGHDVLRDEGAAYASRLSEADVAVEHDHYPAMAHGFLSLTDAVSRADEAMDRLAKRVRERLS
ncbi:alpha/beta hydrolase [Halovivax limisalsi]|uniref:alpha/beta hydrolase n=1 Tax=Halovivax limisalsi TaxID=1453760 RepID=UPI001FFC7A2C|nr:alpha/beta hydrolase [Halovivax limisalsi]